MTLSESKNIFFVHKPSIVAMLNLESPLQSTHHLKISKLFLSIEPSFEWISNKISEDKHHVGYLILIQSQLVYFCRNHGIILDNDQLYGWVVDHVSHGWAREATMSEIEEISALSEELEPISRYLFLLARHGYDPKDTTTLDKIRLIIDRLDENENPEKRGGYRV